MRQTQKSVCACVWACVHVSVCEPSGDAAGRAVFMSLHIDAQQDALGKKRKNAMGDAFDLQM